MKRSPPSSPKESDVLNMFGEDSDEEKERDLEVEGGKLIPRQENATFSIFGHELVLKQQLNKCGGHLWRCATILLKYFENEKLFPKRFFEGKRILEVGAGTGLVGIALSKIGAIVTLTDLQFLLPLMNENIHLNNLSPEQIQAKELCWGETDCTPFCEPPLDYILAVECIYLEDLFEPLLKTLEKLSSPNTIILAAFIKKKCRCSILEEGSKNIRLDKGSFFRIF